uniref:Uncharacterized protein n=1 Tax=Rhizobium leguminosarum TaxID=384 RepID=A0A179BX66_RHILE|nr:hypothetical protein A4U53_38490 [Rhizobium leguminosarum]
MYPRKRQDASSGLLIARLASTDWAKPSRGMDANVKAAPVANNLEIQCILFSKQFHEAPSFFGRDFVSSLPIRDIPPRVETVAPNVRKVMWSGNR